MWYLKPLLSHNAINQPEILEINQKISMFSEKFQRNSDISEFLDPEFFNPWTFNASQTQCSELNSEISKTILELEGKNHKTIQNLTESQDPETQNPGTLIKF